ncbi:MAG: tripartite tricarboxylate transporter substrate binding protein, partial [Rhodospirillales bacterium]
MNVMTRLGVAVAIAMGSASLSLTAVAADYPDKPVKIIVPFGAGDALDATARVIAEQLSAELGVPFPVQNIPGAGGGKGTAEAAKAAGDGYTLLMGSTGAMTARPQISSSGYKTDDFIALAQLVEAPIGIAVKADSPFNSVADIIAAAKAEPGKIKYATPGPGASQHINMEIFAKAQGIKLTHIGGQGGQGAVTKTLSGEVDFVFVGASNDTALANGGKLRVIALGSPERVSYFPDVPTVREQGFAEDFAVWFGLVTNKGTPADVVAKLRASIAKVANTDKTLKLYATQNLSPAFLDGDAFQKRIDGNVA